MILSSENDVPFVERKKLTVGWPIELSGHI